MKDFTLHNEIINKGADSVDLDKTEYLLALGELSLFIIPATGPYALLEELTRQFMRDFFDVEFPETLPHVAIYLSDVLMQVCTRDDNGNRLTRSLDIGKAERLYALAHFAKQGRTYGNIALAWKEPVAMYLEFSEEHKFHIQYGYPEN